MLLGRLAPPQTEVKGWGDGLRGTRGYAPGPGGRVACGSPVPRRPEPGAPGTPRGPGAGQGSPLGAWRVLRTRVSIVRVDARASPSRPENIPALQDDNKVHDARSHPVAFIKGGPKEEHPPRYMRI